MTLRTLFIVSFLLLLMPACLLAQDNTDTLSAKKGDTLIFKSTTDTSSSSKSVMALDTAVRRFNPKTAVLRSAILPGWGQWYNKKYWKVPIVYGALGTAAAVFFFNLKTYKELRLAVKLRSDTDTANDSLIAPELRNLPTDFLRANRNVYRQNIDYSVLAFLFIWGLNVVDASVDAHLKAFDVSPDIGMKIRPGFNSTISSPGISLVFFVKDKSTRPRAPLP